MRSEKLYILVCASLLLMACSDSIDDAAIKVDPTKTTPGSPVVNPSEGEPIMFSASMYDDAETRDQTYAATNYGHTIVYGLDTDNDGNVEFHDGLETESEFKSKGFGVYAFYTGTHEVGESQTPKGIAEPTEIEDKEIVMLNQQVTWDNVNNKWSYTPMQFWPASTGYMSFFAYAPFSETDHPYIGTIDVDYSVQGSGSMEGATTYNKGKPVILPTIEWNYEEQKDLIWGMAKNDSYDISKSKNAFAGFSYKNIHSPKYIKSNGNFDTNQNGTLHWQFRHALARVKFSVYNFMNILQAYDKVATGIPTGVHNATDETGPITITVTNATDVFQYVAPENATTAQKAKEGWYVFFDPSSAECHKFDIAEEGSRKLVITNVGIKNYAISATLHLDNKVHYKDVGGDIMVDDAYAYEPHWEWTPGSFSFPSMMLNDNIYESSETLSHLSVDNTNPDWWEYTPFLVEEKVVSMIPLEDSTKEHYLLMVPRKYDINDPDQTKNLYLEVSYTIISKYKLEGKYTWFDPGSTNSEPELSTGTSFSMEGISGTKVGDDNNPYKITVPIDVDIEANHSYHVVIRMGETMKLLYEVTDWDNNMEYSTEDQEDTPITNIIPTFD